MKKYHIVLHRVVIGAEILTLLILLLVFSNNLLAKDHGDVATDGLIKYVDFNANYASLNTAYKLDLESYGTEKHLNWIELLSYAATKGGGDFNQSSVKYINSVAEEIKGGKTIEDITKDMKYYNYYYQCYSAVLDGLVGEYDIQNESGDWEHKYGLKGYNPIAKGFSYCDYDDFGVSRSYGYRREHLGHDMMGMIGTPIIAVESGYVEVLGWNQYGGWRIGIRSFNHKRYYYYAHLRQNRPYAENLKEGDIVTAGDVIGYMGHTGYSAKENVNNIDQTHLHFGLELVFDESQKESNNEIWVDCYALTTFLAKNRCEAVKNEETKEWTRKIQLKDPAAEEYENLPEEEKQKYSGHHNENEEGNPEGSQDSTESESTKQESQNNDQQQTQETQANN